MTNYNKADIGVNEIQTDYYNPENSQEFLSTLGILVKAIFPLEHVVVHKSTMQLIANGHYLQLAIQEGKRSIQVVFADFPNEYLIHAVATHWKPTTKYAKMYKFIGLFMNYYTKKGGVGAKFRKDDKPQNLRELVAEILGTNRTYLDMIEAIGDFNRRLLELVDEGGPKAPSLKEAFAMVPKRPSANQKTSDGSGNKREPQAEQKKNYTAQVTDLKILSDDELDTIVTNLPNFYAKELIKGILPDGLSVSKNYTNNNVFQGFSMVYEKDGKSIIIYISYTDDLRASLLAA